MRGFIRIFLPILFAGIFFSRCAKDKALNPEICDSTFVNISYSLDVVPILTTYCTDTLFGNCHYAGNEEPYGLTTYEDVKAFVDLADENSFYERVLGPNANMPKDITNGPTDLEPCDLEKLRVWIAEGALDN